MGVYTPLNHSCSWDFSPINQWFLGSPIYGNHYMYIPTFCSFTFSMFFIPDEVDAPRFQPKYWRRWKVCEVNYSCGHLLVITGYKWNYTFYTWGYKYLQLLRDHNFSLWWWYHRFFGWVNTHTHTNQQTSPAAHEPWKIQINWIN